MYVVLLYFPFKNTAVSHAYSNIIIMMMPCAESVASAEPDVSSRAKLNQIV